MKTFKYLVLLACMTFGMANVAKSQDDLTFTIKDISFTMKYVKGGSFKMGATSEQTDDAKDNESPVHRVKVSSFYMGETEVTQDLWNAVMDNNPSYFKGDNLPVDRIKWDDCQEFIRRLNSLSNNLYHFRLPTEAEWEYAARGGKHSNGTKYSGGSEINSVAWFADNSSKTTHSVKSKLPNELGLYDMNGNVWEWCSDWFDNYKSKKQTDPQGPTTGIYRVLRGGSWMDRAERCRVSLRNPYWPTEGPHTVGFRIVMSQN